MKGPNGQSYRGVRQQFVSSDPRAGSVAVLSGVEAGERVVTLRGLQAAPNGAAVVVNNEIQPRTAPRRGRRTADEVHRPVLRRPVLASW